MFLRYNVKIQKADQIQNVEIQMSNAYNNDISKKVENLVVLKSKKERFQPVNIYYTFIVVFSENVEMRATEFFIFAPVYTNIVHLSLLMTACSFLVQP